MPEDLEAIRSAMLDAVREEELAEQRAYTSRCSCPINCPCRTSGQAYEQLTREQADAWHEWADSLPEEEREPLPRMIGTRLYTCLVGHDGSRPGCKTKTGHSIYDTAPVESYTDRTGNVSDEDSADNLGADMAVWGGETTGPSDTDPSPDPDFAVMCLPLWASEEERRRVWVDTWRKNRRIRGRTSQTDPETGERTRPYRWKRA